MGFLLFLIGICMFAFMIWMLFGAVVLVAGFIAKYKYAPDKEKENDQPHSV